MIWTAVLLASAGCYLLKLAGLSLPHELLEDVRVRAVAAMLPVALLAALVTVGVFGDGQRVVLDARAGGLVAAVGALLLRAPFLVVLVVAVAVTATVRQAG